MFVLNLFVWAQASSTALPFGTLVGLAALWLLIQLPLVYVGSFYGFYRKQAWEHPTKTNSMPRQIPSQSWYTKRVYSVLLAGLVPFAVIFIELLFVFRSLWQDKSGYYYVFGFLSVVSLVLIVTIIEVTIIATYLQLCAEVSPFAPRIRRASADGGRIITGGGSRSSSAAEVHSGSFCTAHGIISNSRVKGSSPACSSSATASSGVGCTDF